MTEQPTLIAHDLSIGYKAGRQTPVVVAPDLNFTLNPGEMVCLIGPNGVGKTTLMRTIAGLLPPLAGEVRLQGQRVDQLSTAELARHLSLVLTERVDVGLLTAEELVALGRHPYTDWMGRLTSHDAAVVRWALEVVGATPLAGRAVDQLSDGERQKVMIARALAQEPALLLLDEPTAFLDLPRRVEIMGLLRQLAHRTQRAVLLSSHDLDLTLRSADRIWLLDNSGRLHAGAPEDLVLNGTFEAAFRSAGVAFDARTGSFIIQAQQGGAVALEGEGLPLIWTRRALERAGFQLATNGTVPLARVYAGAGSWKVTRQGQTQTYHSVHDLIQGLLHSAGDPVDDRPIERNRDQQHQDQADQ
jgi:iron complex transport system ATP-binding protein